MPPRQVLGSSSIEDKSVNDLIHFIEAKEAACDAAVGSRPGGAAAAASSSAGQQQPATTATAEERPAKWRASKEVAVLLR